MDVLSLKERIITAGERAVEQLIEVAEERIIIGDEDKDLAADKLKNAAATKKLAIFDAFEILNRIEEERTAIANIRKGVVEDDKKIGFAESYST